LSKYQVISISASSLKFLWFSKISKEFGCCGVIASDFTCFPLVCRNPAIWIYGMNLWRKLYYWLDLAIALFPVRLAKAFLQSDSLVSVGSDPTLILWGWMVTPGF